MFIPRSKTTTFQNINLSPISRSGRVKVRMCPGRAVFESLPASVHEHIFTWLGLPDLVVAALVDRHFASLVAQDERWLPVLSAPELAELPTLSLAGHGGALRRLFARYLSWLDQWLQVRRAYIADHSMLAV